MTFEEARAELKVLAGGRYRSLKYEFTEKDVDADGSVNHYATAIYSVYVDPSLLTEGKTWREALDKMTALLQPVPVVVDLDEAPVVDADSAVAQECT